MAENVPPSSAQQANNTNDQPGRPYYEQLRTNLRQTLEKKRRLDEQLVQIEEQIFKTEGSYLEETANSGNIVRGFDGWVKGVQVGGRGGVDDRRRGRVRDEDRVFSRSSVSWMRVRGACHSPPCLVKEADCSRRKMARIRVRHRLTQRRLQDHSGRAFPLATVDRTPQ